MRSRLKTFGVALLIVCVAGCSWPAWGGGAEHRGAIVVPGLTAASARTWVSRPVLAGTTTTASVDANGTVFVVRGSRLLALDPGSGAVVWAADLPAGTTAGGVPAVETGRGPATVYVDVV